MADALSWSVGQFSQFWRNMCTDYHSGLAPNIPSPHSPHTIVNLLEADELLNLGVIQSFCHFVWVLMYPIN